MARRPAKFTLANLIGAVMLIFIFAAGWPAIQAAIETSWTAANGLTKAALVIIIPGILFAIGGYILSAIAPRERPPMQQLPRDPRRRRRRR